MQSTPACQTPPSTTFRAALRQFNAGAYFACHETLEELWRMPDDPLRDFYKGLLQIAVGLLHRQKGNLSGARALLTRGCALIAPQAPTCLAVDVAGLLRQCEQLLQHLEDDAAPIPQIQLAGP